MGIPLRKTLPVIGLVASLGGCANISSVSHFGTATSSFADGMSQTAGGSYDLCQAKLELTWDWSAALGNAKPKQVLKQITDDECSSFRKTGATYAQLARQIGGFGEAMAALATAGEADYSDQLATITGEGSVAEALQVDESKLKSANRLVNRVIGWFTAGYSRSKISIALRESETEVESSIEVLEAVLTVYETQLNGYQQTIEQVAGDADFNQGPDPSLGPAHDSAVIERQINAQIEMVRRHGEIAKKRRAAITASKEALTSLRKVHKELVEEAERRNPEFDTQKLLTAAGKLIAKVSEYRNLVEEDQVN